MLFSFCFFNLLTEQHNCQSQNSTTANRRTAQLPITEQDNCQSQNNTSDKYNTHTTQNTKEHKRTKHNNATTNNKNVQCHYNKSTNRCCHKTPLTTSHLTYSKQISIQQTAVRNSDRLKLPTVNDLRYAVRNRDREQVYKCTTVSGNYKYHLL